MIIEKALLNRLICAKYLFLKGMQILSQGGPFSAGFALLNFQDSAEMVLRIIAQQIGCTDIKEKENFDSIIEKINKKRGKELSKRTELIQMNKARVNFKHFGNKPKEEDVFKFSRDLEEFFPKVLQVFLNIDFKSISLADLIEHKRTENYIKKAEQSIDKKNYENAIKQSAIAFEIFYKHHTAFINDFSSLKENAYHEFEDHGEKHEKIIKWGREIEKAIIEQQSQLNIIINGINLAEYRRFKKYTPYVRLYKIPETGDFNFDFKHSKETIKDIALFCYRFVIDAIFLMKEHKFLSNFPVRYFSNVNYKVIKKCDVLVRPFEDSEIIRETVVGEILNTFCQTDLEAIFYINDKSDFLEINQDSDRAFVKKDSVEIYNNKN